MEETEKEEYIFDAKPKITNIDINYMATLQKFYSDNGFIPENHVSRLLDWLVTSSRLMVCAPTDDPREVSYTACCGRTSEIIHKVTKKMGIEAYSFNIGKVFTDDCYLHALIFIKIPVLTKDGVVDKYYMLDPTFRQFCKAEENRFERYFEEPRYSVEMSTPHPGYFLNLTESGRQFANGLIENGYFELTKENIKRYFDAFALYLTPKEKYLNDDLLGRISETDKSSDYYMDLVYQNIEDEFYVSNRDVFSPLEIKEKEQNRFINRLKSKFRKQNEMTLDDFSLDDDTSQNVRKM